MAEPVYKSWTMLLHEHCYNQYIFGVVAHFVLAIINLIALLTFLEIRSDSGYAVWWLFQGYMILKVILGLVFMIKTKKEMRDQRQKDDEQIEKHGLDTLLSWGFFIECNS